MARKNKKVSKLAYLGLLGYIGIFLALYTRDNKWFGLVGFFPFLNYYKIR